MHRIGDFFPACDLFRRMDSGGVLIALAFRHHLGCLGDDQARRGTLGVILGHQGCRYIAAGNGAVAGQGCHGDAVGESDTAKAMGIEKGRHEGISVRRKGEGEKIHE